MTWGKRLLEGWQGASPGVPYNFVLVLMAGLCMLYPSLGDSSMLLPPGVCSCSPDMASSLLLLSVNVLVSAYNSPVPGPGSLASPGCPTTPSMCQHLLALPQYCSDQGMAVSHSCVPVGFTAA